MIMHCGSSSFLQFFIIPDDDIELVVDPGCINNPLQSPVRPSESAITKGYRLMDAATGEDSDEDFDTAVKFVDLGSLTAEL